MNWMGMARAGRDHGQGSAAGPELPRREMPSDQAAPAAAGGRRRCDGQGTQLCEAGCYSGIVMQNQKIDPPKAYGKQYSRGLRWKRRIEKSLISLMAILPLLSHN